MSTDNLPEQVYSAPGTAVAARLQDDTLDASDILIPRMKIGQKTSRDVLEYGGIYILESRDDMEPFEVMAPPAKGKELGDPIRFYIHADPVKGWSWKPAQQGGPWRGRDYPDLHLVQDNDPRNVRRTYDYLITVPSYTILPVKFIMHGEWGGQAAKQINTQIKLARLRGVELHTIPFKLQARKTSKPADGQERPFIQAVVGLDNVPAKDLESDLEIVNVHHALVADAANVRTVEDDDTDMGQGSPATSSAPALN